MCTGKPVFMNPNAGKYQSFIKDYVVLFFAIPGQATGTKKQRGDQEMKAAVWYGKKDVRIMDVPEPPSPGPGE
ncbi:MAG: hypothetical protein ACOYU3_00635, partial [Bacillota bacterium]